MTDTADKPDQTAATPVPNDKPRTDAPELESEMYRVLFDHEMDRGTGMTKIPQVRRRRRPLKE